MVKIRELMESTVVSALLVLDAVINLKPEQRNMVFRAMPMALIIEGLADILAASCQEWEGHLAVKQLARALAFESAFVERVMESRLPARDFGMILGLLD